VKGAAKILKKNSRLSSIERSAGQERDRVRQGMVGRPGFVKKQGRRLVEEDMGVGSMGKRSFGSSGGEKGVAGQRVKEEISDHWSGRERRKVMLLGNKGEG